MKWIALLLASAAILAAQTRFAGAVACASCHPAQSKPYRLTGMSNALQRAGSSDILRGSDVLTFSEGPYRITITRDAKGSTLTVTDGKDTISTPIQWAFGLGTAGQTYIYELDHQMYESRVSYYNALKGLDLTMGAQLSKPATLIQAAGRRMDKADVKECFGCHSTGEAMTPRSLMRKLPWTGRVARTGAHDHAPARIVVSRGYQRAVRLLPPDMGTSGANESPRAFERPLPAVSDDEQQMLRRR